MGKNVFWMVLTAFSTTHLLAASAHQNNTPQGASNVGQGQNSSAQGQSVCIKEKDSRLQIGGDYTYVKLKPSGNPSFHGNLGGAQGMYEYQPPNYLYAAVSLAWKEGSTKGSSGKRSLLYIDAQERIGYTFGSEDNNLLTLFSGVGYRHYGQRLSPKAGTLLHFQYNEIYIPVGFIANFCPISWFCWGLGFTWKPQVYPTVAISSLKGARWTLTDTLANFCAELPLTFSLTSSGRFSIILKPFYEYWQDGHTTAVLSDGTPLGIPKNTYNFFGADLNFAYSF